MSDDLAALKKPPHPVPRRGTTLSPKGGEGIFFVVSGCCQGGMSDCFEKRV